MIDLQDVIRIPEILIDNFGGSKGIPVPSLTDDFFNRLIFKVIS